MYRDVLLLKISNEYCTYIRDIIPCAIINYTSVRNLVTVMNILPPVRTPGVAVRLLMANLIIEIKWLTLISEIVRI